MEENKKDKMELNEEQLETLEDVTGGDFSNQIEFARRMKVQIGKELKQELRKELKN